MGLYGLSVLTMGLYGPMYCSMARTALCTALWPVLLYSLLYGLYCSIACSMACTALMTVSGPVRPS